MDAIKRAKASRSTIYQSTTFDQDLRIRINEGIGTASISPAGRDVALASQHGLHIVDLDAPFSPPRRLRHETPWVPADVQWSPFASRYYWVVSTSNQRVLVWNLELSTPYAPIEHVLDGHTRAITDLHLSPHHPDALATSAVGGFVHCWDLRCPGRPSVSFTDWDAGASQIKWSARDPHLLASSHDRFLRIWDERKGATPLKSIDGHATKIYGIDWSKRNPQQILTCSLDHTIKTWAYEQSETEPIHVIKTHVPMCRARHTPFGSGVLAMPQRGEPKLYLYDQRKADPEHYRSGALLEPDYVFKGHRALVRDFLWRARGTLDSGTESRDFQLITWGSDNELILHRVREKHLKLVGYERGAALRANWPIPGRASPYVSFRDPPEEQTMLPIMSSQIDLTSTMADAFVHNPFANTANPGMKRAPIPLTRNQLNGALTMTYSSTHSKNGKTNDRDLIAWMKGVKFGKRTISGKRKRNMSLATEAAEQHSQTEALSEEIIHVGETFKKISFEEIDISGRRAVVSFNGPWAADKQTIFLRLQINFDQGYPEKARPHFHFERLSTVSDEQLTSLEDGLSTIAEAHLKNHLGCLQAVLFYLLGEYDLQQSIRYLVKQNAPDAERSAKAGDSSSDEEENLGQFVHAQTQTLELDFANMAGLSIANVPLSNHCGAAWAPDNRLVCFFRPKIEPRTMLGEIVLEEHDGKHALFERFGRLHASSPRPGNKSRSSNTNDSRRDDNIWDSESGGGMTTDSSSSGEDANTFRKFNPTKPWRGPQLRFRKVSQRKAQSIEGSQQHSTYTGVTGAPVHSSSLRSTVSIHVIDDIIAPGCRALALEYQTYGDGVSTCSHNALKAANQGLVETAYIWRLLELVLATTVPLNPTTLKCGKQTGLVMTPYSELEVSRSSAESRNSAGGAAAASQATYKGDVKWCNHPFGREWLVKVLFAYLEKRGDVQMLGLLSCVLARPSTSVVGTELGANMFPTRWPSSFVEYLPSQAIAKSSHPTSFASSGLVARSQSFTVSGSGNLGSTEESRVSSVIRIERQASDRKADMVNRAQGSHEEDKTDAPSSSFSSDHMAVSIHDSELAPPLAAPSGTTSFAASVWSRSFNLSSSPPASTLARMTFTKNSGGGDDQPASSIHTAAGSGSSVITFPTTNRSKIVTGSAAARRSFLAQELTGKKQNESGTETEYDEPTTPPDEEINVTLKNQSLFDDEGGARLSLLDPARWTQYRTCRNAYARTLDAWGMLIQKQEILKYNGVSLADYDELAQQAYDEQKGPEGVTLAPANTQSTADEGGGLAMTRCCTRCGRTGQATTLIGQGKCIQCAASMRIMSCTICLEPVDALLKSCLNCGHAAHLRCLGLLSESLAHDKAAHREAARVECEAGCGCECYQTVMPVA